MLSVMRSAGRLRERLDALQNRDDEQMRRMDKMTKQLDRLAARIEELEEEIQEERALGMRVAQLSDIVQELLIPVADRDEKRLKELLGTYADSL
ncbi:MAG: hypothetical protein H0U61_02675 [Nocardioidaceae bacterium]|nr:hypothetical protein [Nocardioidaceae bacterium]